mgnify:CR=1 FL=1|jgi:endoglucanase
MKRFKTFAWVAALALAAASCTPKTNLEGTWYGQQHNTLLTVTFNPDSTLEMTCEASSNFSMKARYSLDERTSPMQIDLTETGKGMTGAGIVRVNPDRTLELCIDFGAMGAPKRPTEFNSQPASMATVYYKLTRDKESVLARTNREVDVPAEARLAFERNKRLGAGINLNAVVDGNLHPGYERDAPLADAEIKSIADVGFQSIRLVVCWVKHASTEKPYTIDPAFLKKVDHIVDECIKNGMAVSIDQHYYPYINMMDTCADVTYEENYERLYCLWEQLAEHYKDYSNEDLFFDLLNEPNLRMGADKWNEVIAKLVKIIRKTNPGRTILVGTPNLGQHWTLNCLQLPQDDWNLIVEFHYYLPHLFTHNGLAYAMATDSRMNTWMGTDEEKAPILYDLDFCKRWSDANGRPLNMGEYGTVNTVPLASRARYLGFLRGEAAKRGISSHLWGYREIFQIRDEQTGAWDEQILEALDLPKEE